MIYIISHKNIKLIQNEGYQPLQVGVSEINFDGYIRDNTGINISAKNPNYCELTGAYWAWKNSPSKDYIGIVHYRRYFGYQNLFGKHIYYEEEIANKLSGYDIVLPRKVTYHVNAKQQMCSKSCTEDTYQKLRDIVADNYPSYLNTFMYFFSQNRASQYNMLYCSRELYDDYCGWLFSILFELEKEIDYSGFTEYQKRIYGFLSERLLNIWVINNKLRVKYLPVINTEESWTDEVTEVRRNFTNMIRYTLVGKRYERIEH